MCCSVASTKLFVGNLPEDCTQKDLQGAFEVHGEVTECDIIKNYAFVVRRCVPFLAAISTSVVPMIDYSPSAAGFRKRPSA